MRAAAAARCGLAQRRLLLAPALVPRSSCRLQQAAAARGPAATTLQCGFGVARHAAAAHGRGSVRCHSTPSPTPPPPPGQQPQRISWLAEVQTLMPSGSNGGGGGNGGGDGLQQPRFKQLTEADLGVATSSSAGSSSAAPFDAIMILAGGLARDGGLPEWVHRRLDVARDLHALQDRRPALVCLGGGTPHKPDVVGASGHVIHESTSCASYLMATGASPDAIFKEVSSYDTVGNAYFSLCIHALPAGWRRVAVVTSAFHMPRTRALFAGVYRRAGASLFGDPDRYSLTFLSASDEGVFDDHVLHARLDKEAASLRHWQQVSAGLPDLAAFHAWLTAEHLCYAVRRQGEFGKRTIQDDRLLDSY